MVLAVAEYEIDVAVPVQVELVYALQDTRTGHVEILTAVAKGPPAERLESTCNPG